MSDLVPMRVSGAANALVISDTARPMSVRAAQAAYYRAEADDLQVRSRAFSATDKMHGAILRRRDAALALAAALEAEEAEASP